jgi:hypothetical protein
MTLVPYVVPLGGEHCDFCCASPVSKLYKCANFEFCGHAVFASDAGGSWVACEECAELVDQAKWGTLTARAMQEFAKRQHVSRHELSSLWAQFTEIHRLFEEHMLKES